MRRKKNIAAPISARPTTPPTTPPAIAPVFDLLCVASAIVGVGVILLEEIMALVAAGVTMGVKLSVVVGT